MSVKYRFICLKFSVIALFLLLFQAAQAQERYAAATAILEQQTKGLKQDCHLLT